MATTMLYDENNSSIGDFGYTSGYTEYQHEKPEKAFVSIILPTIYSIVCIVGLIGNGLVIYIMHLKVRNRNITDLYVLNLAIADFIFVAMLPFWTASIAMDIWPFGQVLCKLASGCTYFHLYASVFFLTVMSVDRFIAVVMYQTRRRTLFCARCAVVTIWLVSTLLGILPLYFRDVVDHSDGPKCDWSFDFTIESHMKWFMVYIVSRSIIGFVIPLLIILISYSLIIFFLKTRETKGKLTGKCQDRATKMVLVVIAVFLVCWLPNQVSNLVYVAKSLNIMEQTEEPDMLHYYVHMFSTALAWMHSCMNPILYAFMREDMRLKLTEILNHNIKRCCGENSFIEIRVENSQGQQEKEKTRKSSRAEDKKLFLRPHQTESFRLTTTQRPSVDGYESVNCEEQPLTLEDSSKRGNEDADCEDNRLCITPDVSPVVSSRSLPSMIMEEQDNRDSTEPITVRADLTEEQEIMTKIQNGGDAML